MKTTLDLVDLVWGLLKNSSLDTATTGAVYKYERPKDSALEDTVINSLPIDNDDLQSAIVNVNIFVPGLDLQVAGVQNIMPDHVRLKVLAALAVTVLKDGINGLYTWDVQQQHVFKDDEAQDQYYINIRLQFYVVNI